MPVRGYNEASGSSEPSTDAGRTLLDWYSSSSNWTVDQAVVRRMIRAIEAEARDKAMRQVVGHWQREREARELVARAASPSPDVTESVTTERASAQSLVLQYLQGRDDIPEPTLSSLKALAEQDRAASAQAVHDRDAIALDVDLIRKALVIGAVSWDGDGWYAKEAGYNYDDARETLRAAEKALAAYADASASNAEADREAGDLPCAACGHIDTDHDQENRYGEAVMCWCSCPDFVKRDDQD